MGLNNRNSTNIMKPDLQIKEKINGIYPLIAEIDFNVSTLEQFYGKLSAGEMHMFDKYQLLNMMRSNLWNLSMLDLCKLFLENENYSFNCLINILVNNYSKVTFKKAISLKELKELIEKVKPYEVYIQNIKDIRDMKIAHKDSKNNFNTVMLYQLRALINLAQEIFNPIYSALYDSDFIWDFKEDTRELSMIKNLAKYESIFTIVSRADISREIHIKTNDLIRIIK